MILLLLTVCQAQEYDDYTPAPDYDNDYNATFDYSFFSNTSNEDLEKFKEQYVDENEGVDTGGRQDEAVGPTAAPTTRTRATTEEAKVDVYNAASLPVSPGIRTLVWTLVILISLNLQQLRHTL